MKPGDLVRFHSRHDVGLVIASYVIDGNPACSILWSQRGITHRISNESLVIVR